jgi:hypothetical protein
MREGRFYKFWVYIMAGRTVALCVGMTGFVDARIFQHPSFAAFCARGGFPQGRSRLN